MLKSKKGNGSELSDAAKKRNDDFTQHAQHIFKKDHASAFKDYRTQIKEEEVRRNQPRK